MAYEAIDVGSNPSRSAVERLDCLSFYMYINYNRKRGTVMVQKRLRLKPNKHIESSSLMVARSVKMKMDCGGTLVGCYHPTQIRK